MSETGLYHQPRSFRLKALLAIVLYCGFHLALRLMLPARLGWDDAEQILWAQNFSWAYGLEQPPMYTWLVYAASRLFGPGPLAAGVVRYILLAIMYAATLGVACAVLKRKWQIILAVGSYLLVYQFAFYSHQNLTHSTLASAAVMVTLFAFIAAVRSNAWWAYALLGVSIGCGMMAKYNFAIFPLSLGAAALIVRRYRPTINRRLILTILLAVVICVPYYSQLLAQPRPDMTVGQSVADGECPDGLVQRLIVIPRAAVATVAFPQPLALAALVIFPFLFGAGRFLKPESDGRKLIGLQMVLGVLLAALGSVALGVCSIKARWMAPAVLAFPIYLFGGLKAEDEHGRRVRVFLGLLVAAFVAAVLFRVAELNKTPDFDGEPPRRIPVEALRQTTREMDFASGPIVGSSNHLAGNLVMVFPEREVYSIGRDQGPDRTPDQFPVLYVWATQPRPIPEGVQAHADRLGLVFEETGQRMQYLKLSFPERPQRNARFTLWVAVRRSEAGGR